MEALVQFGVWRDGEAVQTTQEVRDGFEVVGLTVGSISPEQPELGIWLVEVDEATWQELLTEGMLSFESGDWVIEAEMS